MKEIHFNIYSGILSITHKDIKSNNDKQFYKKLNSLICTYKNKITGVQLEIPAIKNCTELFTNLNALNYENIRIIKIFCCSSNTKNMLSYLIPKCSKIQGLEVDMGENVKDSVSSLNTLLSLLKESNLNCLTSLDCKVPDYKYKYYGHVKKCKPMDKMTDGFLSRYDNNDDIAIKEFNVLKEEYIKYLDKLYKSFLEYIMKHTLITSLEGNFLYPLNDDPDVGLTNLNKCIKLVKTFMPEDMFNKLVSTKSIVNMLPADHNMTTDDIQNMLLIGNHGTAIAEIMASYFIQSQKFSHDKWKKQISILFDNGAFYGIVPGVSKLLDLQEYLEEHNKLSTIQMLQFKTAIVKDSKSLTQYTADQLKIWDMDLINKYYSKLIPMIDKCSAIYNEYDRYNEYFIDGYIREFNIEFNTNIPIEVWNIIETYMLIYSAINLQISAIGNDQNDDNIVVSGDDIVDNNMLTL